MPLLGPQLAKAATRSRPICGAKEVQERRGRRAWRFGRGPVTARLGTAPGTALMATLLENIHLPVDDDSEQEQEALWRREFEYAGYGAVKRTLSGTNGWSEGRRQFA